MQVALICAKCGKVHAEGDEATLIVDFRQKHLSFICMNKGCKFDNVFDFNVWKENSQKSPLPRIRTM